MAAPLANWLTGVGCDIVLVSIRWKVYREAALLVNEVCNRLTGRREHNEVILNTHVYKKKVVPSFCTRGRCELLRQY